MTANEQHALCRRAGRYMVNCMGFTMLNLEQEQAGNQIWGHMAAFAMREVTRERRRPAARRHRENERKETP